jgi:hypothetical protein
MNPSDLLNRIRESVPGLSWGFLTNSMIRALLTRESQHNFLVSHVMHPGLEGLEVFFSLISMFVIRFQILSFLKF